MNFHVLTLFPEMILQGTMTSITGRAIRNGTLSLEATDIRDFSQDKRRRVDDYTYGGGAGMLMQAQPVYDAWDAVQSRIPAGNQVRTIYVTPQGHTFTQHMAEEFAMADDLIFLCGHYEGIDERVLEEIVTDYVSIGDYVLTGGELASMVMIDAISRMVPGVLHNDVSADTESFHGNLLEYPQYTRPEEWHGKRVPQELLTGDPKTAGSWRLAHSIERTKERRPDLYERYEEAVTCRRDLMTEKISNMDMISQIDQGHYLLYPRGKRNAILLKNPLSAAIYYSDFVKQNMPENFGCEEAIDFLSSEKWKNLYLRGERAGEIAKGLLAKDPGLGIERMQMYVLTRREKLPVTGLYRPDGKPSPKGLVIRREKSFVCYIDGQEAGSVSLGIEGCVEKLTIRSKEQETLCRKALLTYAANELLGQGKTPYLYCDPMNPAADCAAELGMYPSKCPVYRIGRG